MQSHHKKKVNMKIVCPISLCRGENDPQNEKCQHCGTPLAAYARFQVFQAQLYNQALSAAQSGNLQRARDLFASVVAWCPHDIQAHNGLAMVCFQMGDRDNARLHWDVVLSRRPQDVIALKGLALLAQPKTSTQRESKGKKRRKKRASHR